MSRLDSLETSDRDTAMAKMLQELPHLEAMDSNFSDFISAAAFVPTASGQLRAPEELYDPRQASLTYCCLQSCHKELLYRRL